MIIQFSDLVKHSPKSPGVYMMYDAEGTLLYVGKAKNLNARLRQYLDINKLEWHKRVMRSLVTKVEWTATATESDALVLEEHLIKTQKPKYNIILTDGKMYPMLMLTKHDFPRLLKFRARPAQKKDVFGPYPSIKELHEAIKQIQKICRIRTCADGFMKNRARPCLLHQIGRCSAPCMIEVAERRAKSAGKVDSCEPATYNKQIVLARKILSGDIQAATKELSEQMQAASDEMNYELAAEIRDKIAALSATATAGRSKQQSTSSLIPHPSSFEALETWLGMKLDRVSVFDNSHLFGKNPVGAMIVLDRTGFVKSEYRHFKLRDMARAGNDIAMMEEFLTRFAQKQRADSKEQRADNVRGEAAAATIANCYLLSDNLVIVDGGRAQWNIAKKVLGPDAAVLGVVKGEVRDGDESFILPNGRTIHHSRLTADDSRITNLLRRARDEAHRFAITFHRRARGKSAITSALDEIEGIGAARKRSLLHHFGSVRQIADARPADLARAPGISKSVAEKIYAHFH